MQPQYGAPAPPPNYDFIVNSQQAPKHSGLPGGGSTITRILLVIVGLIVLLVVFSILKGLISGGSNGPALLIVAQDQQEIVHVATAAVGQAGISTTNANFAATAQATLSGEQSQLLAYAKANKILITVKQLSLTVSAATDAQLTTAASVNNFNQTFQQVSTNQINGYLAALKLAYQRTKGAKGRAMLTNDYNNAALLAKQLSLSSNTTD